MIIISTTVTTPEGTVNYIVRKPNDRAVCEVFVNGGVLSNGSDNSYQPSLPAAMQRVGEEIAELLAS